MREGIAKAVETFVIETLSGEMISPEMVTAIAELIKAASS